MNTAIENFTPRHEFLVCIDSDGCAFDTMEIKHKECFCRQLSRTGNFSRFRNMPGKRGNM